MQQSDELRLAIEAITKAGGIIRNGYGQALEIKIKENARSIVTQIDYQSEKEIINVLKSGYDYPILAEESGEVGKIEDTFWVIDPLDGTTNFSRGIPFFSVSIALVKNNQVILGVTLDPLTNELYWAQKGKGAYLNDKPIRVSSTTEGALLVLNKGITRKADLKYIAATRKLSPSFVLRRMGSSCRELCLVAKGSIEGFADFDDKLWDYAAGVLLVSEAGGKVTDWQGNNWDIKNKYVLATNGVIHGQIKNLIANLQQSR